MNGFFCTLAAQNRRHVLKESGVQRGCAQVKTDRGFSFFFPTTFLCALLSPISPLLCRERERERNDSRAHRVFCLSFFFVNRAGKVVRNSNQKIGCGGICGVRQQASGNKQDRPKICGLFLHFFSIAFLGEGNIGHFSRIHRLNHEPQTLYPGWNRQVRIYQNTKTQRE